VDGDTAKRNVTTSSGSKRARSGSIQAAMRYGASKARCSHTERAFLYVLPAGTRIEADGILRRNGPHAAAALAADPAASC